VGSGAQDSAEALAFVAEVNPCAALDTGFGVGAEEPAFGATNGGQVVKDPEVTGDTEASRMGDPLSVAEEDVRWLTEFAKGGQEGGSFTKRHGCGVRS
jgi:hypothetical protein